MTPRHLGVGLLLVLAMGTACRTRTPLEFEGLALEPPAGATLDEISARVVEACEDEGWSARTVVPGRLFVSRRGSRQARVLIEFDRSSLDISYLSSVNLLAAKGRIHKLFNQWVDDLARAIQDHVRGDS